MPKIKRENGAGFLYARVKPYNPKKGQVIQRIHVQCLGRVCEGGTGIEKPIEWVKIRPDQARILQTYKQINEDPESKNIFDIVSLEQRQAIDRAEEAARLAALGIGHAPAQRRAPSARVIDVTDGDDVFNATRAAKELERRTRVAEGCGVELEISKTTTPSPALMAGADAFVQDPAVVGRMQALDGVGASSTRAARRSEAVEEPEFKGAEPEAEEPEAEAEEPEAPPAHASAPAPAPAAAKRGPGRPPKRRGARIGDANAGAPHTGDAQDMPQAGAKPTDTSLLTGGLDINDATDNTPSRAPGMDPDEGGVLTAKGVVRGTAASAEV